MEHRPLFTLEDISKKFPNGVEAVSHISTKIYEGECLLIAGSNGSGKTVLIHMLAGLLEPSGGTITFRGQTLKKGIQQLRREVGLVFQEADVQIIGDTVSEDVAVGPKNLRYSKAEIATRSEAALHAVGLSDKKDFLPRHLSGGEKRRLAIAGVLAMGAEIIIMDEPFANLDWPGVIQVLEVIQTLKETNKTVIILTHELEKVLAFAERLLIVHKGTLCADGSPEQVLNALKPLWGVRDPRVSYTVVQDCSWLMT
ncbi:MAG: energy-coupling factor ABC transporter ATP-binding protein [Treponema sp.]|jgi:biotin transport system ATP-binding protein|nr:energy-coupling factor ABC transporter ATP-binding protein [Treponema sp.]